jgi:PAS domain S-box-containing protein
MVGFFWGCTEPDMTIFLQNYQFTLISQILFGTALIALVIFFVLWQRRSMFGAFYLALFELSVAVWALSIGFEVAATTMPVKYFWSKTSYIGVSSAPLLYFLFCMTYTQQDRFLTARTISVMAIIPFSTFLIALSNERHQWFWTGAVIQPEINLALYEYGAWFWFFVVYTYILLIIGTWFLYRAIFRYPAFYRTQGIALLLAAVFPTVGNLVYLTGYNPVVGLDWTPMTFTISGMILAWSVFKLQFFDLMPFARTYLVESMRDAVFVLDAKNRIVDLNPSAQQLMFRNALQLIGKPIGVLFPDWEGLVGEMRLDVMSTEIEIGDGQTAVMDMQISPLLGRSHRLIGTLIVLRDITRRKQVEAALRELNTTLEAQVVSRTMAILAEKEKIETIVSSVKDALLLTDLHLDIQYVNKAFTTFTGFKAEEIVNRNIGSMGKGSILEDIHKSIVAYLGNGDSWQGEMTSQGKDGRTYDVDLFIAPVKNLSGTVIGYVSSHQDISQRKSLERVKTQFITNISHELRTPVSNIKLYTSLLKENRRRDKRETYLQVIEKQSARLEKLIKRFFEIGQLESDLGAENWKQISLLQLIKPLSVQFQDRVQNANLALEIKPLTEPLPPVNGYPNRIKQAVAELIDNAINFTPAGGKIIVQAESKKTPSGQWVIVSVQDNGPGIPEDEKASIFDRFYRGKIAESGHISGTGLGLAIVKEIVESHHGTVTVDSRKGEGAVFELWLPAAAESVSQYSLNQMQSH